MKQIKTETDLEKLFLSGEELFFVFKHSTRCPVSQMAFNEFQQFISKHSGFSAYLIDVIADRPLSLLFAEWAQVEHASPQVFMMKGGSVLFHTSHHNITRLTLEDAL